MSCLYPNDSVYVCYSLIIIISALSHQPFAWGCRDSSHGHARDSAEETAPALAEVQGWRGCSSQTGATVMY
jgi:hypothetical protein